jgi:hypothetical protein
MRIGRVVILLALLAFARVAVAGPPVLPPPKVGPQVFPPPQWQPPPPPPPTFPWFALMPSWFGVIVAVLYAHKQTLAREEEEEVPAPTDDTEFEYKIVRSPFGAFRKPEKFRGVLAEEARFGWRLVEKFDDTRVRLRRPVSCRQQDEDIGEDPYRIRVGASDGAIAGRIVLGVLLGVAAVVGLLLLIFAGR